MRLAPLLLLLACADSTATELTDAGELLDAPAEIDHAGTECLEVEVRNAGGEDVELPADYGVCG